MKTPWTSPVALLLAVLGAYACGGGDTVQGPDKEPDSSPEQPAILDFSAVEGQWSGTGTQLNGVSFEIRASLESSARPGRTVGGVRYWLPRAPDVVCFGTWIADSVEFPLFVVDEIITVENCPDGTVRLRLDEEDGTLSYHYIPKNAPDFHEASGTLTRDG